jgi:DnaJ-class molecular chaperone
MSRTTKTVSTHFRRTSVRLHPDRNGEHLREQFDAFKLAMDILRNHEKRVLYMSQMLDVIKTMPDQSTIDHSHQVLMDTHASDKVEEDVSRHEFEKKKNESRS